MTWYYVIYDGEARLEKRTMPPMFGEFYQALLDAQNEPEDPEWVQFEMIDNGEGEIIKTPTVNQPLKTQIQLERVEAQVKKAQAEGKAEARREKRKRFDFGLDIKADFSILNSTKGWSDAEFSAYLSDPRVQQLSVLLADGAIETVRGLLATWDMSLYYSTEELAPILEDMDQFILNNPV